MTVETIPSTRNTGRLADDLLASLTESSRAWQSTVERLRPLRKLAGRKPGAYALHETIAAARPALLSALQRALGGTLLVVVATPDAAERSFADILYYLGERSDRVALLRSRDEAIGAIDCVLEEAIERYTVTIAIGRVVDFVTRAGDPLIFFRGAYR